MVNQATGESTGGGNQRSAEPPVYTPCTGENRATLPDRALEALRPARLSAALIADKSEGTAPEESPKTERGKNGPRQALSDFASGFLDAAWGPRGNDTQTMINLGSIALGIASISRPMGLPGFLIGLGGFCYGVFKTFQAAHTEANAARGVGKVIGGFLLTGLFLGQAMAIRNFAYRHHLLGARAE
mgnify:CR=1 FL=1